MAKSSVRANIHQSLDVRRHLSPEVSLDLKFLFEDVPEADHLCFVQFVDWGLLVDVCFFKNLVRRGSPNPIDIG